MIHHHHAHDHGHSPAHAHGPSTYTTAFLVGVALNGAFVVGEAIYGFRAHSLALLSDAGHNLSDVMGLLLAWGAVRLSQTQPTTRRTYGLRRSSILAALANAALLLLVTGAITVEALQRLTHPALVAANTVMAVAGIGVVVNGVSAAMFASGRDGDLNVRGAFAHLAADALIALGVVLAGVAMRATGWLWLDPAVSIAIGIIIIVGTWGLLRESINLAMDAVPEHIDPLVVETYLASLHGVSAVHDLHIWAMSTTEVALTAHLVTPDAALDDARLATACTVLRDRFSIQHCTIQQERGDDAHPCAQASPASL